jgi:deoxyinosine 3'endonuclease (endonuclease V)
MSFGRKLVDPWALASWEGAESEMLAVGARMTLTERLRWLEEATRAARAMPSPTSVAEEIAETSRDPTMP